MRSFTLTLFTLATTTALSFAAPVLLGVDKGIPTINKDTLPLKNILPVPPSLEQTAPPPGILKRQIPVVGGLLGGLTGGGQGSSNSKGTGLSLKRQIPVVGSLLGGLTGADSDSSGSPPLDEDFLKTKTGSSTLEGTDFPKRQIPAVGDLLKPGSSAGPELVKGLLQLKGGSLPGNQGITVKRDTPVVGSLLGGLSGGHGSSQGTGSLKRGLPIVEDLVKLSGPSGSPPSGAGFLKRQLPGVGGLLGGLTGSGASANNQHGNKNNNHHGNSIRPGNNRNRGNQRP
ncbi:hypothetical protein L218DRAFT_992020 [Marasmius fiardii PR-910]|nr:hypothetical protein L218DRAFT_992020 [Marasmius fiardii PR-910]